MEKSLDKFDPATKRIVYRDCWPPGSPSHSDLAYAFKYWAVKAAFDLGCRYVMWLDAGSCAVGPVKPFWDRIERDGYILVEGEDCLGTWISDEAVAHFNQTRDHAMTLKLPGGCLIGLDRENATAMKFFEWWGKLAKETKLFMCCHTEQTKKDGVLRSIMVRDGDPKSGQSIISLDPRVKGHRSDEACFGLMMDALGMRGMPYSEFIATMKTY